MPAHDHHRPHRRHARPVALRGADRLALLTAIQRNIDKTARAHALDRTAVFEMDDASLTVLDGGTACTTSTPAAAVHTDPCSQSQPAA